MRLGRCFLGGCGFVALVVMALSMTALRAASGQPAAGGDPEVCRLGVNIEDLYDFDLARETFGAVLWLWALCPSREHAPLEAIVLRTAMPWATPGSISTGAPRAPSGTIGT
jgi:hypothetical protein